MAGQKSTQGVNWMGDVVHAKSSSDQEEVFTSGRLLQDLNRQAVSSARAPSAGLPVQGARLHIGELLYAGEQHGL